MHAVQVVCEETQVRQGEVQGTHFCRTEMVPTEQLDTQLFPYRLRFLHEVQLLTVREQVRQSPVQATATPDMLRYPTGT